jgi:hypothetical protein
MINPTAVHDACTLDELSDVRLFFLHPRRSISVDPNLEEGGGYALGARPKYVQNMRKYA